ncbi:MAG: NHLP bacteriocin system secretion protein [Actinomycetota bacterium]
MFRQKALEESSGPDPLDEAMGVTASAGWIQLGVLGAMVLIATVWSAVADIPIKVKARGILLGEAGVADITLSSRGRVIEMRVRPGDMVNKGDMIARISQPDLESQLSVKEVSLREAKDRESRLVNYNREAADAQSAVAAAKVQAAKQRITILTERQHWLAERDANFERMLDQGYVAKETVLRNKAELTTVVDQIASARNEFTQAQNDLKLQDVQRQKELGQVREEIARLSADVTETRQLLTNNTEVRSPYTGRVIEVKYGQGEYVEVGNPMVSLVRGDDGDKRVVAVVFVPPENGKEVKPGMRVDVGPASVQSSEYGFIVGKVISVSDAPATTAGMMRVLKNDQLVKQLSQQGAPFEVNVELQTADTRSGFAWTSSKGPNTAINSGTPCEAAFIVREQRLLGLVVPPLAPLFAR